MTRPRNPLSSSLSIYLSVKLLLEATVSNETGMISVRDRHQVSLVRVDGGNQNLPVPATSVIALAAPM